MRHGTTGYVSEAYAMQDAMAYIKLVPGWTKERKQQTHEPINHEKKVDVPIDMVRQKGNRNRPRVSKDQTVQTNSSSRRAPAITPSTFSSSSNAFAYVIFFLVRFFL
jgi:hypothetical protein